MARNVNAEIDLSRFDSSTDFVTLFDSIDRFKNNRLGINNFQHRINFNNEFYTIDEDYLNYYKSYLYDFTIIVKCPEKFYYHPEWVSLAVYNSIDLWFLIMWFNPIASFEEFTLPYIRIFDPKKISIITQILNKYNKDQILNNKNPEYVERHVLKPVNVKENRII